MESYVGDAIRSVLEQTYLPDEILVVDDGSTDFTRVAVESFGDAVVYIHQSHAGVSVARNHGVRRALGEFLCFLDADDRFHPAKLRNQLEAFGEEPALQFCDAYSRWFWTEEMTEEERRADYRHPHPFWQTCTPGHISTWMVHRDAFDRIGLFDEGLQFSEDSDWHLRCRDAGLPGRTLLQCLSFRRLHTGNATTQNRQRQLDGLARVFLSSRARQRGL
jgi:glycosyltransferase involved in cell wall biosynthesis